MRMTCGAGVWGAAVWGAAEGGAAVWAVGAGAELRQTLGTAVFSGMIGVTAFGIFLTPVFYVLMRKLAGNRPLARHDIEPPVLQAAE